MIDRTYDHYVTSSARTQSFAQSTTMILQFLQLRTAIDEKLKFLVLEVATAGKNVEHTRIGNVWKSYLHRLQRNYKTLAYILDIKKGFSGF